MSDREIDLSEYEAKRNVFGVYGGQIGPIMFSTNRIILAATAKVLMAVGLFGFASWLALSLPVTGGLRLVVAGFLLVFGLWTVHVILIEIYAGSARRALEPLQNTDANGRRERQ